MSSYVASDRVNRRRRLFFFFLPGAKYELSPSPPLSSPLLFCANSCLNLITDLKLTYMRLPGQAAQQYLTEVHNRK